MIAIAIVNWNGWADTIECLESLFRADDQNFIAIVCDNGSSDGSLLRIEEWARGERAASMTGPVWELIGRQPRQREPIVARGMRDELTEIAGPANVLIVETGENLGFAGGTNVGLRLAASSPNIEFCWLLNNDTVVDRNALSQLVTAARANPQAGILGSRLMYYEAPQIVQGLGGWYDPWRARSGYIGLGSNVRDLPSPALVRARLAFVIGASMLIRMEVIREAGYLSEDYFLYFEEFDLALRLPPSFEQVACRDSIVYHKEGRSIGSNSRGRPSDTSIYYFTVNQVRFFWRHRKLWLGPVLARIFLNVFLYASKRDLRALRVIGLSVTDLITGNQRRGPITV